ncbi:DDE-type integrase/transposase/recombinase [Yersinia hibernica]|uniref:Transposase n=1 Tax=Yersinia hibernica TaxID=2339259 RepID=A0ABX5R5P4_9GAMM|nr:MULTISPECIES: DDE-type integrase/transposase/recombinase [Yersinia]QAX80858.1 transposase [Yersinia hibernica]
MLIERNSIWQIMQTDGVLDGIYRVLGHSPDGTHLVLFRLSHGNGLERPIIVTHSLFANSFKRGQIISSTFPIPFYQLVSEEEISTEYIALRDKRFELIINLVNAPNFLLEVTLNLRSKIVVSYAKLNGTYVQNIYRLLNLYWKYGQEKNALLPAYKYSGGAGKQRFSGEVKRGRPIQLSTPSMLVFSGVNTREVDKSIFIKAMKKYGFKGRKVSFSRMYDQMLKEFYANELMLAENENREPNIPSYRTFIYWCKKLIPKNELIRKQTTLGDFERNRRALRGKATDHTEVPGSCFELDATVLDVHIVSEFKRNHVLGRPTVYCVVDKESRMIVGIHVSMEYASWRAGRQALVNSFTSKKDYCARFGMEIEDEDWPCNHIPQRLLCDRGEFICNQAEKLAVPLIGHLSIAPPYRADLKGIVEHRFQILNEKLVHELVGTTRGRQYIRGDRDPRLDACLTLAEVTKLLIDAVLDHNSHIFDGLAGQTTLLIEAGIAPTPLNYWNIHCKKHRHALSKADEGEVRARLLPIEHVSMTSRGVRLNDEMYYECDRREFEDWKIIARSSKNWKLEARLDQDNSSFIYVRLQEREGFTRCSLMNFSSNFNERHMADVLFFKDWKAVEKRRVKPTCKSIERHNRRKSISKHAQNEVKNTMPLATKAERINGMKERRKEAILDARITGDDFVVTEHSVELSNLKELVTQRTSKVISLLKRKKGCNK